MKYSETIVSKRLRTLKMTGIFFMLVLIAWIGYTKLLYENGFLQEKKNSVWHFAFVLHRVKRLHKNKKPSHDGFLFSKLLFCIKIFKSFSI